MARVYKNVFFSRCGVKGPRVFRKQNNGNKCATSNVERVIPDLYDLYDLYEV